MKRKDEKPVKQRDIAEAIGVSVATVSMALRNHPRISASLKQTIKKTAEKMGYRTSPLVAAHMASIRQSRPSLYQPTIAFLAFTPTTPTQRLLQGARDRCSELGFQCSCIDAEIAMKHPERFSDILIARGISGFVLGPLPHFNSSPKLRWENFAVAAACYTPPEIRFHRIVTDIFDGTENVLAQVAARGYKRIGFVCDHLEFEARVRHLKLARYMIWQSLESSMQIPPLISIEKASESMRQWIKKYKIDAIVGPPEALRIINSLGLKVPNDIGFATFYHSCNDPSISGIYQDFETIGQAAVDNLIGQLHRNERGLPKNPRLISIDGIWHEGRTLRPERGKNRS